MSFNFLVPKEPNLSIKESEKNLNEVLKLLDIKLDEKNKKDFVIREHREKDKKVVKEYKYPDLVNQVRKTGVCDLYHGLDNLDPIFDLQQSGATTGSFIEMTISWEGYKKTVPGPGRITPSEWELSDDIEFYKEETCIECNSGTSDFEMAARNYRGYLFASTALVDCYINRHIKYKESQNFESEQFEKLQNSRKTEERIKLFLEVFTDMQIEDLKQTKEWDYFKKLHKLRNSIIHATEPYMGISIEEIARNLNYSITGVGSLLRLFQERQGKSTLKFIERVRNSAVINYQYKFNHNGSVKTKIKYNKISR